MLLQKEQPLNVPSDLYPIDESEEFHDPFSELNLFLSKRVKQTIQKHGTANRWSNKIQKDLLEKLLPDFRKQFPHYRIGFSALKKVWEKVMYYYEKVNSDQKAFTMKGNVNITYMIKENLRQMPLKQGQNAVPPYNFSYNLAVKISECIASLDGLRPILDRLIKMIWSAQKHLTPKSSIMMKPPFEQYDQLDRLIVKILLEKNASPEATSYDYLSQEIIKKLKIYHSFANLLKNENGHHLIAIAIAKKIYPELSIHKLLKAEDLSSLERFIKRQLTLCPCPKAIPFSLYCSEMLPRIVELYAISSQIPRDLSLNQLKNVTRYIYHIAVQEPLDSCPVAAPSLFDFVQKQMFFLKHSLEECSVDEIFEMISHCFKLAKELPPQNPQILHEIHSLVWKSFAEEKQDTPFSEEQSALIYSEMANLLIETPSLSFEKCVQGTLENLNKIAHLPLRSLEKPHHLKPEEIIASGDELHAKISFWSLQNDLIMQSITFDKESHILKKMEKKWSAKHLNESAICHIDFVEEISSELTSDIPWLKGCQTHVAQRVWMLYKCYWYNHLSKPAESSFDRFLKWHYQHIKKHQKGLTKEKLYQQIQEIIETSLPMVPFSIEHLDKLVS